LFVFSTVMFSRLMDTGDIFDWPVGDNTPIIFAFNPETSDLRYHGPTRQSKVTINFETDCVLLLLVTYRFYLPFCFQMLVHLLVFIFLLALPSGCLLWPVLELFGLSFLCC
jgi:hypothetical protein